MITAIAHAATAAPLAALLPARRGEAWKVTPAPYCVRPHAATSRLTNGHRALIIAESGGRIEVFVDDADMFPVTPDVVVAQDAPHPVATLAGRILRTVLPRLEREAAARVHHENGWQGVVTAKAADLSEVGFELIDHGAHPAVEDTLTGPALEWEGTAGGKWGLSVYGLAGQLTLTYDGPVHGLYAVLPVLLPPADGHAPQDAEGTLTRHLTARFPQLRPLGVDELEFGRLGDVPGYIARPEKPTPDATADDTTRVVAEFSAIGTDLLLSVAALLV
ncbi:hypothetical protein [Streptomyces griseomycini]|uniref:Uncharacterized protein n=1 Tax=Streptomyces griseomycini TaxID=66895 RepID=A0A7W7VA33_9ACTN|nr:hypothetical protein [Streptomyces griseomycini]MBB4902581.1 hypothetical protein [Streptomyces griseomycini]GGR54296.1 hypothetical protein GCM10015536_69520 [Streptomyces griseomycini]